MTTNRLKSSESDKRMSKARPERRLLLLLLLLCVLLCEALIIEMKRKRVYLCALGCGVCGLE
jgi:hypothetical protein